MKTLAQLGITTGNPLIDNMLAWPQDEEAARREQLTEDQAAAEQNRPALKVAPDLPAIPRAEAAILALQTQAPEGFAWTVTRDVESNERTAVLLHVASGEARVFTAEDDEDLIALAEKQAASLALQAHNDEIVDTDDFAITAEDIGITDDFVEENTGLVVIGSGLGNYLGTSNHLEDLGSQVELVHHFSKLAREARGDEVAAFEQKADEALDRAMAIWQAAQDEGLV